jgi:molybdopterin-guanine dinucleotide biosynthesis protein A
MILAGGGSRRMGTDKLSLKVAGTPLLRRVHDALASRCREVLVVGGGGTHHLGDVRRVTSERPGLVARGVG